MTAVEHCCEPASSRERLDQDIVQIIVDNHSRLLEVERVWEE